MADLLPFTAPPLQVLLSPFHAPPLPFTLFPPPSRCFCHHSTLLPSTLPLSYLERFPLPCPPPPLGV